MIRNIHSPSKVSFIQCLSFTTSSQLGRVNPLMGTGNYSAMSNNTKLVHWPLMGPWAVTFGTARRGLGGAAAQPGPSSLYQM